MATMSGVRTKRKRPQKSSSLKPLIAAAKRKNTKKAKLQTPQQSSDDANSKLYKVEISLTSKKRMRVVWSAELDSLTEFLDYKHSGILGVIVEEKKNLKRKHIPLNFFTAMRVWQVISHLRKSKVTKLSISDDFRDWWRKEQQALRLCKEADKFLHDPSTEMEVFEDIKHPLFHWQAKAVRFMSVTTREGRGVLLFDEVGLGKTITVLTHLVQHRHTALVVCPAGLRIQWARKVQKFTNLRPYIITRDKKNIPDDLECGLPSHTSRYDVLIVSFSMLDKFAGFLAHSVNKRRVVVIDEGHEIRNMVTTKFKACEVVAEGALHTIVMTATPLVNRVKELYSLLKITRRLWDDQPMSKFISYYEKHPEEVADNLRGIMIRRRAVDVHPNGPKSTMRHLLTPIDNREDYYAVEEDVEKWLIQQGKDGTGASQAKALVKLATLRRLAAIGKIPFAVTKLNRLLNAGEKIVTFCSFREPLYRIAKLIPGSAIIDGAVPEDERALLIDRFNNGDLQHLLISTRAGGTGIDLPAARIAFFLDLPWTPATFEQAKGRLLRLDQLRDCIFVTLLAENTIDGRMNEILFDKALTFTQAIGDNKALGRIFGEKAVKITQARAEQLSDKEDDNGKEDYRTKIDMAVVLTQDILQKCS